MSGWLYLIKNGELYKIGITKNFEKRMRQLKPDNVVSKLYTNKFKQLEREFHKRYKTVRIPQTEYFRLEHSQIKEIKQRLSNFYFSKGGIFIIFINVFALLSLVLLFIMSFIYLNIKDINIVLFSSFFLMEKITIWLSFLSLFVKSYKYLGFTNEIKFRLINLFIFIFFSFFFRFLSSYIE